MKYCIECAKYGLKIPVFHKINTDTEKIVWEHHSFCGWHWWLDNKSVLSAILQTYEGWVAWIAERSKNKGDEEYIITSPPNAYKLMEMMRINSK